MQATGPATADIRARRNSCQAKSISHDIHVTRIPCHTTGRGPIRGRAFFDFQAVAPTALRRINPVVMRALVALSKVLSERQKWGVAPSHESSLGAPSHDPSGLCRSENPQHAES